MIGAIGIDLAAGQERLRLTTRAMMALEDQFSCGIADLAASLEADFRVGKIVRLLAECGANGAGVPLARAQEIIDEIGLAAAAERVGAAIDAAFPEAATDIEGSGGKKSKAQAKAK